MTTFDHYVEAHRLADMLRKEDLEEEADALVNAMEAGATGTEIFMALRWNVNNLIDAKQCSNVSEAKARQLFHELNIALNKP